MISPEEAIKIYELRRDKKLSYGELAQRFGRTKGHVQSIIKGVHEHTLGFPSLAGDYSNERKNTKRFKK